MTTIIKKGRVSWLIMRYPKRSKYLNETFTLAELTEAFFDYPSALHAIGCAFRPDKEDLEQIDLKLLFRLWKDGEVQAASLETIIAWLTEWRE